jgi:hypothetical protein
MPRTPRTTKKLAQRIDLNYFKRPGPLESWRFFLTLAVLVLGALWLAWYGFRRNPKVYSSGPMSHPHAMLAADCAACHVQEAHHFREQASDQDCLSCHDGPIHHADQVFTPNCASCHVEHRGLANLDAVSDISCTRCHAHLQTTGAPARFSSMIDGFNSDHPQFAAARPGSKDPSAIKLDHAVHMKRDLLGPGGPVQLDCSDCHRTAADNRPWRFGSPKLEVPAATRGSQPSSATLMPLASQGPVQQPEQEIDPRIVESARDYMGKIAYAQQCISCHPLAFDKRFAESAPHDTPQIVHAFVLAKFQQYIAAHPAELREVTGQAQYLPEKNIPASVRVLTQAEWVSEQVAESEKLLWNKTCKQCHTLNFSPGAPLPTVVPSNIIARWFPHAVFGHGQHRMLACASCHAGALTSQETADILLPGIRTCQQCHHPGAQAAESRCFECHTYHDWNQRKDGKGHFTIPDLVSRRQAVSPPPAVLYGAMN